MIINEAGTLKDKVHIDNQPIEVKTNIASTQLWEADESTAQSIQLDIGYRAVCSIYASATTATTFTVELSTDGSNWITYYQSASAETSYSETITTGFRYIKLSSAAAGTSGTDTVTLILTAK